MKHVFMWLLMKLHEENRLSIFIMCSRMFLFWLSSSLGFWQYWNYFPTRFDSSVLYQAVFMVRSLEFFHFILWLVTCLSVYNYFMLAQFLILNNFIISFYLNTCDISITNVWRLGTLWMQKHVSFNLSFFLILFCFVLCCSLFGRVFPLGSIFLFLDIRC